MSIETMTNVALVRHGVGEAEKQEADRAARAAAAAGTVPVPYTAVTEAVAEIITYIPTETITLYVAVLAVVQGDSGPSGPAAWAVFWPFLMGTPLTVWMVYAAKSRAGGRGLPLHPREWPGWEMGAAAVAFLAWAVSLPGAPFLSHFGLPSALGGVIVLATSAFLGLAAPLFRRVTEPSP